MMELISNSIQLVITTGCTLWAFLLSIRHKSQTYFILACFYGTFALGLVYWLLYLVVNNYTPKLFYVPEISWIASYLFLMMLCQTISPKEEKHCSSWISWIIPLLSLVVIIYFSLYGEFLANLTMCSLLGMCGYISTRGIVWSMGQRTEEKPRIMLYTVVIALTLLEYSLWTVSCNWLGDTYKNPYYWIDFLISFALFFFIPAMKKAVKYD